jgi:hypothetical protein
MDVSLDFLIEPMCRQLIGCPRSRTGVIRMNCPLCVGRGQSRPDRKKRLGIFVYADHIGLHCFNCGIKTKYVLGGPLGATFQSFLRAIGLGEREVQKLNLHAEGVRRLIDARPSTGQAVGLLTPTFPTLSLPIGARSLQAWADDHQAHPDFLACVAYLLQRGDDLVAATTYYWTPLVLSRRIIVPCYHDGRIVGWVARAVDAGSSIKYLKEVPACFLFNSAMLSNVDRAYVFIVEGVFDALAIDGVSALGASLNNDQINWIKQSGKTPIVVPDRDAAGRRLIEIALAQHWAVAAPAYGGRHWWHHDIKDAAEAVQRYGRLYTLRSIIETAERHPGMIRQRMDYIIGTK